MRLRWLLPSCLLLSVPAAALPPGEVAGVAFPDATTLAWSAVTGSDAYNVYRGTVADLAFGGDARCHGHALIATSFQTRLDPEAGEGFFYLVTAESLADGEGSPGTGSLAAPREILGRCTPVMRSHVLDRTGFGVDDWSGARIATLGLQGYIDEQLDPDSIDESGNLELQSRLAVIGNSPIDINELIALQVIRASYSNKQLEEQYTTFWTNHFNTDWAKVVQLYLGAFPDCLTALPQCDPLYPTRAYLEATKAQYFEMEEFRNLAFHGSFRDILQTSFRSAAMNIYLDTIASSTPTANENHAREFMELHTMGVDGGYTQTDVEELARVFTGWTLCKKANGEMDDPLAACHVYYEEEPAGEIVTTFYEPYHDCLPKVLFAGTPEQVGIPLGCTPAAGAAELDLALDAIAAHPSTKRFISLKILQRFVTDSPTETMIDVLAAEWDDASNPAGVGDLREVLRAALSLPEFLDPDRTRSKIKTPLEHFASAVRAIRGTTDGRGYMIAYLVNAGHIPHFNHIPTGYPETGEGWLDTTNVLTRQNFGLHLAAFDPSDFGSDVLSLLADNGVSTAPGNEAAIVDFLDERLFAGTLTESDRQAALFYLTTDNLGNPAAFDDYKVRKTVGVMLGFAQFQEQ